MRDLREIDRYRRRRFERQCYGVEGGATEGCFWIPDPRGGPALAVIASSGAGWDHVSVSLPHRCPTWAEMERVKRLFFREGETAMQLHVPATDHVNHHPYCLHLWRPLDREIPRPPAIFVGPTTQGEQQ